MYGQVPVLELFFSAFRRLAACFDVNVAVNSLGHCCSVHVSYVFVVDIAIGCAVF